MITIGKKNRTTISAQYFKKIQSYFGDIEWISIVFLCFLCVFGSTTLFWGMAPLGPAFFMALHQRSENRFIYGLMLTITAFLFLPLTKALGIFLFTLYYCIFQWILTKNRKAEQSFMTLIHIALYGGILLMMEWRLQGILLPSAWFEAVMEVAVLGGAFFVFRGGVISFTALFNKGQALPTIGQGVSLWAVFAVFALTLPGGVVFYLSLKMVGLFLWILLLTMVDDLLFAMSGALMIGAFDAVFLVGDVNFLIFYLLSTVFAILFYGGSRGKMTLGFLLSQGLLALFFHDLYSTNVGFVTPFVVVVFMWITPKALPLTMSKILREGKAMKPYDNRNMNISGEVLKKLHTLSDVLKEFAILYSTEGEEVDGEDEVESLIEGIYLRTCSQCSDERSCFHHRKNHPKEYLLELMNLNEAEGTVTEGDVYDLLSNRCKKAVKVVDAIVEDLAHYKKSQSLHKKIIGANRLLEEGFLEISHAVQNLSKEFAEDQEQDVFTEKIIEDLLKSRKIHCQEISAYRKNNHLEIILTFLTPIDHDTLLYLKDLIEQTLQEELHTFYHDSDKDTGRSMIKWVKAPYYSLDVGISNRSKKEISGDSYRFQPLEDGRFLVALCDGMGHGAFAHKQSKTVLTMVSKLINMGFYGEKAIQMVNDAMGNRAYSETYSTLDLCLFDLHRGTIDMTKLGSAMSIIKTGRDYYIHEANSLPVGIVKEVEIKTTPWQLQEDDFIVLLSDGILDALPEEGKTHLLMDLIEHTEEEPQRLSEKILSLAMGKDVLDPPDDLTVIVVALKNRKKTAHQRRPLEPIQIETA